MNFTFEFFIKAVFDKETISSWSIELFYVDYNNIRCATCYLIWDGEFLDSINVFYFCLI